MNNTKVNIVNFEDVLKHTPIELMASAPIYKSTIGKYGNYNKSTLKLENLVSYNRLGLSEIELEEYIRPMLKDAMDTHEIVFIGMALDYSGGSIRDSPGNALDNLKSMIITTFIIKKIFEDMKSKDIYKNSKLIITFLEIRHFKCEPLNVDINVPLLLLMYFPTIVVTDEYMPETFSLAYLLLGFNEMELRNVKHERVKIGSTEFGTDMDEMYAIILKLGNDKECILSQLAPPMPKYHKPRLHQATQLINIYKNNLQDNTRLLYVDWNCGIDNPDYLKFLENSFGGYYNNVVTNTLDGNPIVVEGECIPSITRTRNNKFLTKIRTNACQDYLKRGTHLSCMIGKDLPKVIKLFPFLITNDPTLNVKTFNGNLADVDFSFSDHSSHIGGFK